MEMDKKIKLTKDINVTELDGEKVMVDFETGKYFILPQEISVSIVATTIVKAINFFII